MNTVHVHGETLYFDDALDFPAAIFSWWDRGPKGPSLSWVKERIPGCVMGGIDQTIVSRKTPAFLKQHTAEGIRMAGRRRFLLAAGCTIDSWVYPESIRAIVAAARKGC
jgi:uroporphyrinogen decarboxylase